MRCGIRSLLLQNLTGRALGGLHLLPKLIFGTHRAGTCCSRSRRSLYPDFNGTWPIKNGDVACQLSEEDNARLRDMPVAVVDDEMIRRPKPQRALL